MVELNFFDHQMMVPRQAYFFRCVLILREKYLFASSWLSVRMCQRLSQFTDFREIRFYKLLRNSVGNVQIWLKSNKNIGYFT